MIPIIGFTKTPDFNPLAPRDCAIALDAGQLITTDVGVSAWGDYSGNNRGLTQTNDPLQPLFDSDQINGKPAVKFVSANTLWMQSAAINLGTLAGFTVIMVADTWDGDYWVSFAGDKLSLDGFGNQTRITVNGHMVAKALPSSAAHIMTVVYDGTKTSTERTAYYLDGAFSSYITSSVTSIDFSSAAYNFGRWIGGGYCADINIGDFLFFTKALDSEWLSFEHRGFAAKYGITLA